MTGTLVWLIAGLFTGFWVVHPLWVLTYVLLVAIAFASIGLAVAIWSDKFEQLNVIPTFVLTPLTFLGGVFYSAHMLPKPWDTVTRLNPILYMVEGLRFGFLGASSTSPWLGLLITGGVATIATALAARFGGVAEAMEGFGVRTAAAPYGVPVGEVRAISNVVGDRDVADWDIPGALAALARVVAAIVARPLPR